MKASLRYQNPNRNKNEQTDTIITQINTKILLKLACYILRDDHKDNLTRLLDTSTERRNRNKKPQVKSKEPRHRTRNSILRELLKKTRNNTRVLSRKDEENETSRCLRKFQRRARAPPDIPLLYLSSPFPLHCSLLTLSHPLLWELIYLPSHVILLYRFSLRP